MTKKEELYEIVNCDFDKRPVLEWKGFGEVPYRVLPKDKDSGYAVLPVKIDNPYRKDFESAFLNNIGCRLEFSGVIQQITKSGIMFDKVLFTDESCYYDYVTEYCEEHVWVRLKNIKQCIPSEVKVGDTINFFARIILYRRKERTLDYGLADFEYLDKVEECRIIPTREELNKEHLDSSLYNLVCSSCIFYNKCSLMICINHEWREEKFNILKTEYVIGKIRLRQELCYDEMEYLQIKPDKIEDFRLLITEYCDFGLPDYVTRFVECFIKEKSDWAKYMQDNGYV